MAKSSCVAYCTASLYRLVPLSQQLLQQYQVTLVDKVLHVSLGDGGECFLFDYGAWVAWGLSDPVTATLMQTIRLYEEGSLAEIEIDRSEFTYGELFRIKGDLVTLHDDSVLSKLTVSHGLAQSVKLSAFENAIQRTYNSTKQIPDELSRYGTITLSRRAIRQRMGELFNVRSSINLRLDVLNSPDFFWNYPELEPIYIQVAVEEELQKRLEVLNTRLKIIHELFEMLANELNHQHSSRLEWTIIWLIIIEVALTLSIDVLKWF